MLTIEQVSERPVNSQTKPIDPKDYLQAINEKKWLIFLLALVAMLAAFFFSRQQPVYEASATLRLSPTAADLFGESSAVNQIVDSDPFLKSMISEAQLKLPVAKLRKQLHAQRVTGSRMAVFYGTDARAPRAHKITNAAASQFVAYMKKFELDKDQRKTLKIINEQIKWIDQNQSSNGVVRQAKSGSSSDNGKGLNDEIAAAKESLAKIEAENSVQAGQAIQALSLYQQLFNLLSQQQTLMTNRIELVIKKQEIVSRIRETESTRVLISANTPTAPTFPVGRNVVLALVAALLVGSGLAIATKTVDTKDLL